MRNYEICEHVVESEYDREVREYEEYRRREMEKMYDRLITSNSPKPKILSFDEYQESKVLNFDPDKLMVPMH